MLLQLDLLWYFFPPFVGIQTLEELLEEELEELLEEELEGLLEEEPEELPEEELEELPEEEPPEEELLEELDVLPQRVHLPLL